MKTYTAIEVAELLPPDALDKVNAWIARGDGIAVYANEAFDRSDFGSIKFVSFGSAAAQLVVPSEQLPSFEGEINWMYQLKGVYRGSALLEPAATHDFADPCDVLPLVLRCFDNRDLAYLDSRLIAYKLDVGHQPDGARNCQIEISARYNPNVENEWVLVILSAPTHADGKVDRLGPWEWIIADRGGFIGGYRYEGSDPNLGSAIVSACNASAKKFGEGS